MCAPTIQEKEHGESSEASADTESFISSSSSSNGNGNRRPSHHRKGRSSVSFGSVEIREFNRIVGDHPDCSLGPPMSLGWDFVEKEQVAVDDYDREQKFRRHGLYALDSSMRKEILQHGFQVPEEEILKAEKEVEKAARLRERTQQQLKLSKKTQAILKSAARMMFRPHHNNHQSNKIKTIGTTPMLERPKPLCV